MFLNSGFFLSKSFFSVFEGIFLDIYLLPLMGAKDKLLSEKVYINAHLENYVDFICNIHIYHIHCIDLQIIMYFIFSNSFLNKAKKMKRR